MDFNDSSVAVVNEALGLLRQDTPVTLEQLQGTNQTVVARKAASAYESSMLEVLMGHEWGFALRETKVKATEGALPGTFRFRKPVGAVKLTRVVAASETEPHWEIKGNDVIVDCDPVACEYVESAEDVSTWHPLVRRAFVRCLARDLAIAITGRHADLSNMDSLYRDALKKAVEADARETHPDPWESPEYPRAMRRGGGAYDVERKLKRGW